MVGEDLSAPSFPSRSIKSLTDGLCASLLESSPDALTLAGANAAVILLFQYVSNEEKGPKTLKVLESDRETVPDAVYKQALNALQLSIRARELLFDLIESVASAGKELSAAVSGLLRHSRGPLMFTSKFLSAVVLRPQFPLPDLSSILSSLSRLYSRELAELTARMPALHRESCLYSTCTEILEILHEFQSVLVNSMIFRALDIDFLLNTPHVLEFVINCFMFRPLTRPPKDRYTEAQVVQHLYPLAFSSCGILLLLLQNVPLAQFQRRLMSSSPPLLGPFVRFVRETQLPRQRYLLLVQEATFRAYIAMMLTTDREERIRLYYSATSSSQMTFSTPPTLQSSDYSSPGVLTRSALGYASSVLLVALVHFRFLHVDFLSDLQHVETDFLSDAERESMLSYTSSTLRLDLAAATFRGYLDAAMGIVRTMDKRPSFLLETPGSQRLLSFVADFALLVRGVTRSFSLGKRITAKLKGKRAKAFVSRRLGGVAVDLEWRDLPAAANDTLQRMAKQSDQVLTDMKQLRMVKGKLPVPGL